MLSLTFTRFSILSWVVFTPPCGVFLDINLFIHVLERKSIWNGGFLPVFTHSLLSPSCSSSLSTAEEMQHPRPRVACLSPGNQRDSGYFVGQPCRTADCTPAPRAYADSELIALLGGPSFNQPEILHCGPTLSVRSTLPRRVRDE